jgi:photosystem II stability/assembly factor-like uncharacterized protein
MDKDKQLFTHESVDDDIDQLINNRASRSSYLDTRLVSELRHVYKEDAASLKRVWQRLECYNRQQRTSQEPSQQTPQRQAVSSYRVPLQRRSSNTKYPASQLFTVLAATLIGVFLVGSIAWVSAMTHPATPGTIRWASGKSLVSAMTHPAAPGWTLGKSLAVSQGAKPALLQSMLAIRMLDRIHGWALTSHSLLKTSDGAIHWQDVKDFTSQVDIHPQGEFLTAQAAWVAWQWKQSITVLHTSDGGASWQTATLTNVFGQLAGPPRFLTTQQGWLITNASQSKSGINGTGIMNTYHTTDGGKTWMFLSENMGSSVISGISFSNAQIGWVGLVWPDNHSMIGKTIDGGKSWQGQALPLPSGQNEQQQSLSIPSGVSSVVTDAPVMIGANGLLPAHINSVESKLALYTTHDSGATWTVGTLANFDSNDVYTYDTQNVWAEETLSNTLHFSSDGGQTWSQTMQTPQHFGALSFVDTKYGWALDDTGLLYQTTDGGTNWQKLS